jgi:excisionase family DNA binding protein
MRSKTSNQTGPGTHPAAPHVSPLAYGIEDAADALGLSRSRIYELIAAGDIAACKVGRRTIIPTTELTAFLERHRVERRSNAPTVTTGTGANELRRNPAQCVLR